MNPNQAHIDSLAQRITDARNRYYNGSPSLSDAAFDALEDELRSLDPGNAVLKKVGAAPVNGQWPSVRHAIPMGSLNKVLNAPEMQAWMKGTGNRSVLVTEKLDGASLCILYVNRKLVQGVTRGDGQTGDDITRNVLLMQGLPKMLPPTIAGQPTPATVYIRGEVVVLKSDFDTHFKGESNPRNTASGTMKRQSDASKCSHLTVISYQIIFGSGKDPFSRKQDELKALKDAGFLVPNYTVCSDAVAVEKIYTDYIAGTRNSLDYVIDGLVIDVDDRDAREAAGELNGRPKASVALKFPHDEKETVLRNVRWQVGNSGRITPVAEFDPVNLAGANVVQASLYNISYINGLVGAARPGQTVLFEGDKIVCSRAGDVIPRIEAVIGGGNPTKPLMVPTTCPSCGALLQRDGEYLVCKNETCEAQALGALKQWISKLEVLHFGEVLIQALVDEGLVADIADLYTCDPDEAAALEVEGRRIGDTATKAFRNLHAKKAISLHVLIGSLSISLIGRSMAKTIMDAGFDTLSKMYKARYADIAAIPGVGDVKAKAFVDGLAKKIGLIAKLLDVGIQIQENDGALKGMSFCFTGFRDADLSDAIEKAGGTMKSSVSKGLTYLVALDPASDSGKAQKALQYGTKVISIPDAKTLVKI
jgi:DNA ligase (NAD+)